MPLKKENMHVLFTKLFGKERSVKIKKSIFDRFLRTTPLNESEFKKDKKWYFNLKVIKTIF